MIDPKEDTLDELIAVYIDRISDSLCGVCMYENNCSRGVSGGPNGPIYPPCADGDDPSYYIDEDALQEAVDAYTIGELDREED